MHDHFLFVDCVWFRSSVCFRLVFEVVEVQPLQKNMQRRSQFLHRAQSTNKEYMVLTFTLVALCASIRCLLNFSGAEVVWLFVCFCHSYFNYGKKHANMLTTFARGMFNKQRLYVYNANDVLVMHDHSLSVDCVWFRSSVCFRLVFAVVEVQPLQKTCKDGHIFCNEHNQQTRSMWS